MLLGTAVVSLGALGAVVRLTLAVEPTYLVRQDLYEDLSLADAVAHFDEISSSADSVSLFTEWRGPLIEQVWLKRRVGAGPDYKPPPTMFGATRATVPIHPIRRMPAVALTDQLGVPGPWHERLPHFRMDHTPSAGAEIQTEYLIPRGHAASALLALDAVRERFQPLLQVSEVRTVAADDLWMSTAGGRASVALHFTWQPDATALGRILPIVEGALAPFDPRPHWGKVFTIAPEVVRAAYAELPGFVELIRSYDPDGTFHNDFIRRNILGE